MASKLPPLPDVQRLSPRVIRILGGNPSKFTLQGTNTYLIGEGPRRTLIDTGGGERSWIANLKNVLAEEEASLEQVLITHWHPDHVGGIKDVQTLSPAPKIYKHEPSDGMSDITDGQKFTIGDSTLRAFHSPGHTTDHMAWVLEEEDTMFTGDNILGHGTAVFEDLEEYLESLNKMAAAVGGRGYPGHGEVLESVKAKAEEYISHRAKREQEVIQVLDREAKPMTLMEIVKIIYKDVPENLHLPASKGVLQILHKLQNEGKVVYSEEDEKWSLQGKASL